jgi:hypothetical protein
VEEGGRHPYACGGLRRVVLRLGLRAPAGIDILELGGG